MTPVEIRRRLLCWYDRHGRALPWRRRHTSHYRIWIAEMMLIQTQVDTVIPFYRRFLERFPSVRALAAADLDEVLKLWEGLGYYARARNLHRAARIVCEEHGGRLPRDPTALRALPGIGEYVAGAIRSIAFGEPVPAVDGNVRRVLCRLHDRSQPPASEIHTHAAALARGQRPGDVNQALMDLASGLCRPRSPDCAACPLRKACLAHRRGTAEVRPRRRESRPRPHHHEIVGVVRRGDGAVLLARRPVEGLLGGLWEFPSARRSRKEPTARAVSRAVEERTGVRCRTGRKLATLEHAYSHLGVTLHAYHCTYSGGRLRAQGYQECAWVEPSRLEDLALATAHRRIAETLEVPR